MSVLDPTSGSVPSSSASPLSGDFNEPSEAIETPQHLVFVDAAVQNPEQLLTGFNVDKVVLLDSKRDGINQISEVLAQYQNLASVHIFSHGDVGTVQLGNTLLSTTNLEQYASQLQQWGDTLSEQGDLLFYGCNVAYSANGLAFIQQISELTGADVAASEDTTGNDDLNGDWSLEVTVGDIEDDSIIDTTSLEQYAGILPVYNGKEYVLTSTAKTWEAAQAEAQQLGGNLVTINDAAEETWLKQTFGTTEGLWIGINDRRVEGQFEWVNGEAVTYTNWAPGEPNNAQGNQDYGWMNRGTNKQWDDHFPTAQLRGIVEIASTPPPGNTYNGKEYVLTSTTLTWEAAQAQAQQRGGNLVTINDAAEETWLKQTFGTTEGLWIGINDRRVEGQFEWVNGEAVTYTNWAPGEPNNAQGNQDYGWMNRGTSKQWDDNFPTALLRGIIEIDSAPGAIGLETSTITVNEGNGSATVTVLRNQGSAGTVTVDYRTVEGSAATTSDYTPVSGTLTFAPGETRKTVAIPIVNDSLVESAETFGFAIDNVTGGATLLVPRTAQVTIQDNDGITEGGTYNGNRYVVTNTALTWEAAQAEAQRVGGNLVTINDAAEETWLKETFGTAEGFWIGINDRRIEGRFEWVNGEAVTYTNWAFGEPNNAQGNQDYGWMNRGTTKQWDDNFPTALLRGIIEIGPPQGGTDPGPETPILTQETVITGLVQPTAVDWTPDGSKMFVAEKRGTVRVYQNGTLLATPFINIIDRVNNVSDRGLLDIAVHPDFPNNPYVYLLYAYDPPEVNNYTGLAGPNGGGNRAGRLTRVTADSSTNYTTAVPGSEVVLLGTNSTWDNFNGFVNSTTDFDEPPAGILPDGTNLQDFLAADSTSHTIGSVEFGPDGALYVTNGDGTSFNRMDPRTVRVQDIDNLSGKVLRINPMTGEGLSNNPFYNGDPDANRSKVYQYGVRNAFRITVHPVTGQVYVGDVGWTRWEEVNAGGPGANFGWPYFEGGSGTSLRTVQYQDLPEAQAFYASGQTVVPSILALNHSTDGINAIVMGDVYTGNVYPEQYRGDLFFNDLGQGIVRNISFNAAGGVASVETFTTGANVVVQINQGPDGLLYYVDLDDGRVGRWLFT